MPTPASCRSRPFPELPIRCVALVLALGLGVAAAQTAPASAPPVVVDLLRLEARAHAASGLSSGGRVEDARTQLDRAASGPLAALSAAGVAGGLRAHLEVLRTAAQGEDARATREAVARLDTAIDAEVAARLDGAGSVQAALVALVREAGREGLEGANAGGGTASTEPRAYASALASVALDFAQHHGVGGTARDALAGLRSALGTPGATGADADVIRSATDNALAAMGAPPSALDTERAFGAIDDDLTLAEQRYRAGDAAGTREALIDAYLEHFEDLEPPLEAAAPDLKEHLEHTLRDTLRSLAAQGVPPGRFEAAVEAARADLVRARQALP